MDAMNMRIAAFIEARVMARWVQTQEPPTVLKVTVEVEAQ